MVTECPKVTINWLTARVTFHEKCPCNNFKKCPIHPLLYSFSFALCLLKFCPKLISKMFFLCLLFNDKCSFLIKNWIYFTVYSWRSIIFIHILTWYKLIIKKKYFYIIIQYSFFFLVLSLRKYKEKFTVSYSNF